MACRWSFTNKAAVAASKERAIADIIVKGLAQNNLKHVSVTIPKEKITVFTSVSDSGKSSIVFDTIAAEAQRQINAAYPAFVRSRLPKFEKTNVELTDNLTASVVADQSPLGGNARSAGEPSAIYMRACACCFKESEHRMWVRLPG